MTFKELEILLLWMVEEVLHFGLDSSQDFFLPEFVLATVTSGFLFRNLIAFTGLGIEKQSKSEEINRILVISLENIKEL